MISRSTGLTQLGARAYDASLGRFISVDPLMDLTDHQQMHGYTYANNNPATFEDSSGLMLCIDVCGPGGYLIMPPTGSNPGGMYDYSNQQIRYHSPQSGWTPWYSKPNVASGFYQTQASPEHLAAQRELQEAKQKLIKAATGLAQLVADELGITAGLECFTTGNLAACGETALNVALMFVGGLPAKIAAKYGLRWGKAVELGRKIAELGGELIDGITGLIGARKKLDALPEPRSCPIGNSFVPGTQVVMADGSTKPIEEVETGDKVLATDPETGEQAARTVLATIVGSGVKALVEITIDPTTEREAPEGETVSAGVVEVDTENAGIPGPVAAGDVIIATEGHPFWVPELKAWVEAVDLAPGMWLQTSAGTWVQINAIQAWSQPTTVHNLTVQGIHTYHVATGTLDVLNHNCGGNFSLGDQKWENSYGGDLAPQGISATLDKYGVLEMTVRSPKSVPGLPAGTQMVNDAIAAFGGRGRSVDAIRGVWNQGELGSNLDSLNSAVRGGVSTEDSVWGTFTGKYAARNGYSSSSIDWESVVGPPGRHTEFVVEFSR